MSVGYTAISWTRQKRRYDSVIVLAIALYLLSFAVANMLIYPEITPQALIIRATGTLAFFMLHVILLIGPLARFSPKFLPLLYNRRHLGVSMFLLALIHGVFSIFQFHSLGNTNPIVAVFTSNLDYDWWLGFPFQVFGFIALFILFLMAASSHDYWLKNLGPRAWKNLHMAVYAAYAMLVYHVFLGVLQLEKEPGLYLVLLAGIILVTGAHLAVALFARPIAAHPLAKDELEGFIAVAAVDSIPDGRAILAAVGDEDVAIYKYDHKIAAVTNVCRHQQGPLSEGKVIDGCITCPWHGWQYRPENGCSPPPFEEKVSTFRVRVKNNTVYVHPEPLPPGTPSQPASLS